MEKEDVQRSAKARDLTLNYYEAGAATDVGGGLPLVMLHGGGPGASAWSNFGRALPHFAGSFRTLLIDQPGFGGSDKPPVVGNYYRFAADHVAALLDEVGISPELYESEPGRTSLVAHWGPAGSEPGADKEPILLHGHLDVVPARAEDWSQDPFGAEVVSRTAMPKMCRAGRCARARSETSGSVTEEIGAFRARGTEIA